MTTKPAGILDEVINQAVRDALAEHLSPLLQEVRRCLPPQYSEPTIDRCGERFVSMTELCERMGVNRTTLLRRERVGKVPRRRTFPDGRRGWSSIEIDDWFKRAALVEPDAAANAALAARIRH